MRTRILGGVLSRRLLHTPARREPFDGKVEVGLRELLASLLRPRALLAFVVGLPRQVFELLESFWDLVEDGVVEVFAPTTAKLF